MKINKFHEIFQERSLEIFQNFHEIFKYFKVKYFKISTKFLNISK